MPDFKFQLQGFTPANRDATVVIVEEKTGKTLERKPFLDGSLLLRKLDPGFYQIKVTHPNLINPIWQNRIRLFPQPLPTNVTIPVPEDIFTDTPIRDIPDADLGPIQQSVASVRDQVAPIGNKIAGEVIKSSDWNILVGAVSDLAGTVLELTNLVSPKGHDHPEIAEKIAEVQKNLLKFSEAYGQALLQLQREIETSNMRRKLDDLFNLGKVSPSKREDALGKLDDLNANRQASASVFTKKLSALGGQVLSQVTEIASKQDDPDAFYADPVVQEVMGFASQYHLSGVQNTPEGEMGIYQKTNAKAKSLKLGG
jgi:hypothetical protein